MGIAAYNRGTRAISNQLFTRDVRYVAPKPKIESNLPEGILRSTWLPDGHCGGTQLFLSYEKGWYLIHTRFTNFRRKRKLEDAISIFEHMEMFGLYAYEALKP